ncbi:MAG: hypothetical protein NVS9B15_11560 [Acidobacteriaceae bacterium]
MGIRTRFRSLAAVALTVVLISPPAEGYSVLTHEAVVDIVWESQMKPLILKRFPQTTPDGLKEAHAYAYGGAVVQDLGYYPFGNTFFSDLVHYVRSGDFVEQLIQDASDPDEFAFALGALAHYASDVCGHPAVNRSVAIEFPALARKFGPSVTYEQSKSAHLNTEFGFDVLQVAKQRFNFDQYHSFIGFQVSKPLLERAFEETYGIKLSDVIANEDLAVGTYRWSVGSVIPEMTKVALATRNKQDLKIDEKDTAAKRKFIYHISRADYEKEFGSQYSRPGPGARFLAFLFRLLPKIGPLRALKYKDPTPQTEDLYLKSVDATITLYRSELQHLSETRGKSIDLENRDFDTGKLTEPGEYQLTDATHAKLALKLLKQQNQPAAISDYLHQYFRLAEQKRPKMEKKEFWKAIDEYQKGNALTTPAPKPS